MLRKGWLVTVLMLMLACGKPDCGPADPNDPTVACGYGVVIRGSDVNTQLKLMSPDQRAAYSTLRGRRTLLGNMIERELMVTEARKRGIDQSFDVIRATKQHLIHALRGKDFFTKRHELVITDDEIRAFYEENFSIYHHPIQRECSHILCASEKDCTKLLPEIGDDEVASERFQYLARLHSLDAATRETGGVLGWIGEDDATAAEALRQAAFALESLPGLAGPVRSPQGWHLLWVGGWRQAIDQTLEQAREDVFKQIERKKWADFVDATDERLMAGKKIELYPEKLAQVPIFPPPASKMATSRSR